MSKRLQRLLKIKLHQDGFPNFVRNIQASIILGMGCAFVTGLGLGITPSLFQSGASVAELIFSVFLLLLGAAVSIGGLIRMRRHLQVLAKELE